MRPYGLLPRTLLVLIGLFAVTMLVLAGFMAFSLASLGLVFLIGSDFFPTVDSGQIRLHARAAAGTRIEKTEMIFADIENEIRQIIPAREIQDIIDSVGLHRGLVSLFGRERDGAAPPTISR